MLISSLLERAVLPAETQSVLIERSGGNPLFAEEFIQLLVDRGLIDLDNHDRPVAELHDIPVPESLQLLIGSRLDQLPYEDKALLQDAAVIGKVFWSGALAALCGCDEASVHDRLTDVLRRELVRPQPNLEPAGPDRVHVLARADPRRGVRPDPRAPAAS